jgi:DNA repair exonuclease SbcCD nuclease subunit
MKIAFLGDAHWGVRNNSEYFLQQQIKFYEETFFPYLLENKIDTVIQFGDLLDQRKFINIRIMNAVKEHYFQKMEDYGINHYVILGNHDIVHKNTSRLSALREIVGEKDFPHTILIDEPRRETFGDCQFDFIPWINQENYDESLDFIKSSAADYLIGHLEINGFEMHAGVKCQEGMSLSTFKDYDTVYSGHFHAQSKYKNIHYIGTPYEMTWADYGQRKGFHIFDTETRTTEFIKNPKVLYHKIIYNDENVDYDDMNMLQYTDTFVKVEVEQKINDMMFERFVDSIQKYCHDLLISDRDSYDFDDTEVDKFDVEDSLSVLLNTIDSMNLKNMDSLSVKQKIIDIHDQAQNALEEV